MQETSIQVNGEQRNDDNSDSILQDNDRKDAKDHNTFGRERTKKKLAQYNRRDQQYYARTDSAALLRNLQIKGWDVEYEPFPHHRHTREVKEPQSNLGRSNLQQGDYLLDHKIRNRDEKQ
jgi:hypothetical protein